MCTIRPHQDRPRCPHGFTAKKREISISQTKPSVKLNRLKSLANCHIRSNPKGRRQTPCTTTNFPVPHTERKNYTVPRYKDANCPRQTLLAFQTTHRTIITTTRSPGTKCRALLIVKRIAASKQLSTICIR
uniref:Uncharacterized protein n=1 Tax=Romanomermis culicivorax TaxID=13658 RepID=A0A915L8W5_ROMCU